MDMKLLDSDIFSLLVTEHPRVTRRYRAETEEVSITIVTFIEVLEGRFAFLLKAADGGQLLRAQARLDESMRALAAFSPMRINAAAAGQFDQLRKNKKLKKIGRRDLLIAALTKATQATLVSRNLKDFRQVPGLVLENWAD
jgi:tRNA(fMet)-specific endonuclease VapC